MEYKFRITYCTVLKGTEVAKEVVFCYFDLRAARKNYKAILLGLYRRKDLEGFRICLNRYRDEGWENGIHFEVEENGR